MALSARLQKSRFDCRSYSCPGLSSREGLRATAMRGGAAREVLDKKCNNWHICHLVVEGHKIVMIK